MDGLIEKTQQAGLFGFILGPALSAGRIFCYSAYIRGWDRRHPLSGNRMETLEPCWREKESHGGELTRDEV